MLIQTGPSNRGGFSKEVTFRLGPGRGEVSHAKIKGQSILGGGNRDAPHPLHS